jgi:hypothetical protein
MEGLEDAHTGRAQVFRSLHCMGSGMIRKSLLGGELF